MCFCGILPAQSINILIRKSPKLFNSLQAEGLKTKRELSNVQPSSGYKRALFQLIQLSL